MEKVSFGYKYTCGILSMSVFLIIHEDKLWLESIGKYKILESAHLIESQMHLYAQNDQEDSRVLRVNFEYFDLLCKISRNFSWTEFVGRVWDCLYMISHNDHFPKK